MENFEDKRFEQKQSDREFLPKSVHGKVKKWKLFNNTYS